jgi:hypothetical protein
MKNNAVKLICADTGEPFETKMPHLYPDSKRVTAKEYAEAQVAYARGRLLKVLKPGSKVYTVLRKRSASGMTRHVDAYTVDADGDILYLSGYIERLAGYKRSKEGALIVSGSGMCAGFSVVYDLGEALWPNGTDEPHGTRNGEPDSAGGYALKQQWI